MSKVNLIYSYVQPYAYRSCAKNRQPIKNKKSQLLSLFGQGRTGENQETNQYKSKEFNSRVGGSHHISNIIARLFKTGSKVEDHNEEYAEVSNYSFINCK